MNTTYTTNKKVTINDVAKEAGVSKKTVSRVLNNESSVTEKTRLRVQEAIAQLNYSPDPQARGLASKRSFLLALIYDNPNADFVSEAMYGMLGTCQKKGYELVIHPSLDRGKINIEGILTFIQRIKVDGVALLPPLSESQELIYALRQHNVNYVRLLSHDDEFPESLVQFDDQRATKDVVKHLISQGHKRIGFVKGTKNSLTAQRRYIAFLETAVSHSIALPENYIQEGNFTFQSGFVCGEKLLNLQPRPTAIFASNDEMALGIISAANKLNINIPNDLALVGFDDTPHSSEVIPSLTTVNLQVRKLAGLAAEKLLLMCDGEHKKAAELPHRVTSELIIRDSTSKYFSE